jgi:hypothetical protein
MHSTLMRTSMKYSLIVVISIFSASISIAQEQNSSLKANCTNAPSIVQLEPLTEEERIVLEQLDQIENRAEIVAQAIAEAQVPLDAFGGCGAQQFLLTIPAAD